MTNVLISRKELSKYLKLSPLTVFRLTQHGKIPHYRVGKSLRYDLAQVSNALSSLNSENAAANTN